MWIPTAVHLALLALPLLFVDWQVALIWAFISQQTAVTTLFSTMSFGGFEVFVIFLVLGAARTLLFRGGK